MRPVRLASSMEGTSLCSKPSTSILSTKKSSGRTLCSIHRTMSTERTFQRDRCASPPMDSLCMYRPAGARPAKSGFEPPTISCSMPPPILAVPFSSLAAAFITVMECRSGHCPAAASRASTVSRLPSTGSAESEVIFLTISGSAKTHFLMWRHLVGSRTPSLLQTRNLSWERTYSRKSAVEPVGGTGAGGIGRPAASSTAQLSRYGAMSGAASKANTIHGPLRAAASSSCVCSWSVLHQEAPRSTYMFRGPQPARVWG
mmetsp:Transcript_6037/g.20123  ORF Transcript_6037/g.20123 Transcript_6037/m.20123 type:complete len:258 (-) Transcript_6037:39-812(-)